MAHWRDALQVLWRVLWHGLPVVEPEVREVPVFLHGEEADLFLLQHCFWALYPSEGLCNAPAWHDTMHRSCEEAFAAAGGDGSARVTRIAAIKHDGKYYYPRSVPKEIKLAPKPKKAKGARK